MNFINNIFLRLNAKFFFLFIESILKKVKFCFLLDFTKNKNDDNLIK